MKLLFISSILPAELITELKQKSKISLGGAADVFQKAVVQGLCENNADFDVITFPCLGCFPLNYKAIFTPSGEFSLSNGRKAKTVSYCTVVGLKEMSIHRLAYKEVKSWLKRNYREDDDTAVLTYNFDAPVMLAVKKLKKMFPKLKMSTIVTDLVDNVFDFRGNNGTLKLIQQNKMIKSVKSLYPYIDKYILLTRFMEEKIPESAGRNIVVEGIASQFASNYTKNNVHKYKSLLYAGTLQEFSGVKDLVDAFMLTKEESFRLVICGKGVLTDYIIEKSKADNRIIYKGIVLHKEVLELQQEATVLVNPRKPNGNITRYSFPSKTMEYMSSGIPMIGYKLEGIPEEYFEWMFTVNDNSVKTLKETIETVLNLSATDLADKAERARNFVQSNKTAKLQVKKILDFIVD